MVTNNILQRTFRIIHGKSAATAFTIENKGIQYIVTARHLFKEIQNGSLITISILRNQEYIDYSARVMFHQNPNIDCAVLITSPYTDVTERYTIECTLHGITLGQDVYFLGYPFEYDEVLKCLPQTTTPVPFVKKACLSGISEEYGTFFLDGINNPGFSGGPVCYNDPQTKSLKVAGLINCYRYIETPVYKNDKAVKNMTIRENTGIIYACSIQIVFEILEQTENSNFIAMK